MKVKRLKLSLPTGNTNKYRPQLQGEKPNQHTNETATTKNINHIPQASLSLSLSLSSNVLLFISITLTARCQTLESLQLPRLFNYSTNLQVGSSPRWQELAFGVYRKPVQSYIPPSRPISRKSSLMLLSHLRLGLPCCLSTSGNQIQFHT
jgi:hypothetical protein